MANTLRIKRRAAGGAAGAPASLAAAELAYNEQDNVLYYGKGDVGGVASTVVAIAGSGAYVGTVTLGANNGVATLDATGKLTTAQIPTALVGVMSYVGVWNASTNSPTITAGAGTKGSYYKVSAAGATSIDGNNYWQVGDMIVFNGTAWDRIEGGASEVSSVFGRTGAVTLSAADVATATGQTSLATGILKNTTTSGAMSIAVAGTDYALPNANTTGSAAYILNGTGSVVIGASLNARFHYPIQLKPYGGTGACSLAMTGGDGAYLLNLVSFSDGTVQIESASAVTGKFSANTLKAAIATGTAPLEITSTTLCTNLNANYVGGVNLAGLLQTSSSIDGGTF